MDVDLKTQALLLKIGNYPNSPSQAQAPNPSTFLKVRRFNSDPAPETPPDSTAASPCKENLGLRGVKLGVGERGGESSTPMLFQRPKRREGPSALGIFQVVPLRRTLKSVVCPP